MEEQTRDVLDYIYAQLHEQEKLSTLEQHIVDSIVEFKKRPVDKNSLMFTLDQNFSTYNWLQHKDLNKIIALMPEEFSSVIVDCGNAAELALLKKLLHQIYMMHSILQKQKLYKPPKRPRKKVK